MKTSNLFLTPNQAAKFLNVSLSTMKKFIYSGQIKTLKTPGGHHRIRKNDLFRMMRISSMPPASTLKDKKLVELARELVVRLENLEQKK